MKLFIEVDGGIHNARIEYDENRDGYLVAGGYTVLWYSNEDVQYHLDHVLDDIRTKASEI